MSIAVTEKPAPAVADSLRDVTRPWFLYLLSFRQMADRPAISVVRPAVDGLLAEMDRQALATPQLNVLYGEVRPILIYFADEVLLNCGWSDELEWSGDLLESRKLKTMWAGTQFFALLQAARTRGNKAVLESYYKCIALGFRGMYAQRPVELAAIRQDVAALLSPEVVKSWRFCPEAYDAVQTRPFVKFPVMARAMAVLAIASVLLIVWLSTYGVVLMRTGSLDDTAHRITTNQSTTSPQTK